MKTRMLARSGLAWNEHPDEQADVRRRPLEFARELISERTIAGLAAARARGRKGGRPYKMTPAKLRLAMAAMGHPDTNVGDLCIELGITRQTLYRHVSPTGELRDAGRRLMAQSRSQQGP